jgi:hypothetical protein
MATTTITNRCREYLLNGDLDFAADTYNMALYNGSGHDANTNTYTSTAEASGTGYTAKGVTMSGVGISVDTTNNVATVDWTTDPQWTSATITATDCMIFAESVTSPASDPAVYIGDFSGSKSSSSGNFTVVLPAPAYNTAIIRIA